MLSDSHNFDKGSLPAFKPKSEVSSPIVSAILKRDFSVLDPEILSGVIAELNNSNNLKHSRGVIRGIVKPLEAGVDLCYLERLQKDLLAGLGGEPSDNTIFLAADIVRAVSVDTADGHLVKLADALPVRKFNNPTVTRAVSLAKRKFRLPDQRDLVSKTRPQAQKIREVSLRDLEDVSAEGRELGVNDLSKEMLNLIGNGSKIKMNSAVAKELSRFFLANAEKWSFVKAANAGSLLTLLTATKLDLPEVAQSLTACALRSDSSLIKARALVAYFKGSARSLNFSKDFSLAMLKEFDHVTGHSDRKMSALSYLTASYANACCSGDTQPIPAIDQVLVKALARSGQIEDFGQLSRFALAADTLGMSIHRKVNEKLTRLSKNRVGRISRFHAAIVDDLSALPDGFVTTSEYQSYELPYITSDICVTNPEMRTVLIECDGNTHCVYDRLGNYRHVRTYDALKDHVLSKRNIQTIRVTTEEYDATDRQTFAAGLIRQVQRAFALSYDVNAH